MSSHKPRRPRWPAINNTFAVAQDRASKLDPADIAQIMQTITISAKALREGVATELQWSIVAGSIDMAGTTQVRMCDTWVALEQTNQPHFLARLTSLQSHRVIESLYMYLVLLKVWPQVHSRLQKSAHVLQGLHLLLLRCIHPSTQRVFSNFDFSSFTLIKLIEQNRPVSNSGVTTTLKGHAA